MPTMAIVEDTLRSLQLCGVLAGDKNENMRMRGYASGHLHPGMRLLDLTGPSPGLLPSRLKKTATSPGEKAILESCEKTYLVIKGADSSVLGRGLAWRPRGTSRSAPSWVSHVTIHV